MYCVACSVCLKANGLIYGVFRSYVSRAFCWKNQRAFHTRHPFFASIVFLLLRLSIWVWFSIKLTSCNCDIVQNYEENNEKKEPKKTKENFNQWKFVRCSTSTPKLTVSLIEWKYANWLALIRRNCFFLSHQQKVITFITVPKFRSLSFYLYSFFAAGVDECA